MSKHRSQQGLDAYPRTLNPPSSHKIAKSRQVGLPFAVMPGCDNGERDHVSRAIDILRSRIALGEVVLFTGAGFSRDALSISGGPIVSSDELRSLLWPVAFGDIPEDDESSLGDVFDCAVAQSPDHTREILESNLQVDHHLLPSTYEEWFGVPWARVYTLNVDNLVDAVSLRFNLTRKVKPISAADPVPSVSSDLWCVHLNHRLTEFPDLTFSMPQYARRLPGRDPWHATLAADVTSRTVIYVGTTLDEPPLWQHLELRGQRPSGRELRPRSFLVTPKLPLARQQMLESYNVQHLAMSGREFANKVFPQLADAIVSGHQRLTAAARTRQQGPSIPDVSRLRNRQEEQDLRRYLLGREPTFEDITDGYAIQRSFEGEILNSTSILKSRVLLITGTAGTGKSTALRRLALSLDAAGNKVGWFDPRPQGTGIPILRRAIVQSGYDYVVVDDVDVFAEQSGPFLREIAESPNAPRIIAAVRSTRSERLQLRSRLKGVDATFITAPPLTDSDIDGLIESLKKAGLLGRLAGQSRRDQRQAFSKMAGRQLLVAMIEATSGQSFQAKIDDEVAQLPDEQRFLYAVCALATRNRTGLELDEIFAAAGATNSSELDNIDALKRQYLIVADGDERLAVRHRVIADQVTKGLRKEGHLAGPVEGLLFSMAVIYLRERSKSSRAFRLMVRLLNHESMIHELRDKATVRRVYNSVRSILSYDPHYWLQSGSFELKRGDLDLAENYLNQAMALDGENHRVRSAWCHMSLRRAANMAKRKIEGWSERAEQAMNELDSIIQDVGAKEYHAFHILGSQGLHYARQAPLSFDDRRKLLERLRRTVARGVELHSFSDEMKRLRDDLDKEYMKLAVKVEG